MEEDMETQITPVELQPGVAAAPACTSSTTTASENQTLPAADATAQALMADVPDALTPVVGRLAHRSCLSSQ